MRKTALALLALSVAAVLAPPVRPTAPFTLLAEQQPQQPPQQPPRPQGEQPPVTFKVEVNYVEIDAVVTDKQGNFVRNLTKDDFLVFEEGKPQTVTVSSLVDIPVEKFDAPLYKTKPIEPDVRSNRKEFNGRVFVIVLDDLNTSFRQTTRVRLAARQFVERYLGANDVAAVVNTGGGKSTAQEFTGSRDRLLRTIDTFAGRKERSATSEKIDDYNRLRQTGQAGAPQDGAEGIRAYKARNTFIVLKNVADYMAGIRGRRKAVVFFSEGVDYDIYDPVHNTYASEIRSSGQDAIAAATRANVSFYSVDPRGLWAPDDIELVSVPTDPTVGLGAQSLLREMQMAQDSLRTLSGETGGFAALDSNDYSTSFERIIQDNSSYYVLGYYSTNTKRDGQFRTLTVRPKNPALQVRARKGYVAPRGRAPAGTPAPAAFAASAAIRGALDSPVPVTGLAMSAFAAPMAGAPGAKPQKASVLVVVEVDASSIKFAEKDGLFTNNVELAIMAIDDSTKVRDGAKDVAELKLRPETHAAVVKNGVRLTRRLSLPPGRYQLRIGARESVGGQVGSVMYDLDVPDFSKGDLLMGGLLLTSATASRVPTANPDADFKDILPASPSSIRDFPTGDQLAVAVDIYDNRGSTPHRVEIRTTITNDAGTAVFSSRDERKSEELKGGNTFGHVAAISLKGVAPGRYVLRVEAQQLISNGKTAAREIEIRVH